MRGKGLTEVPPFREPSRGDHGGSVGRRIAERRRRMVKRGRNTSNRHRRQTPSAAGCPSPGGLYVIVGVADDDGRGFRTNSPLLSRKPGKKAALRRRGAGGITVVSLRRGSGGPAKRVLFHPIEPRSSRHEPGSKVRGIPCESSIGRKLPKKKVCRKLATTRFGAEPQYYSGRLRLWNSRPSGVAWSMSEHPCLEQREKKRLPPHRPQPMGRSL